MNMESKFVRIMRNSGPARFFIPVGLILIIFGVIMLGFRSGNYEETAGKVTEVTEDIAVDEDNKTVYNVRFTYEVDGKSYNGSFDGLGQKYAVGDPIQVFYDPSDPGKVTNAKIPDFIWPVAIAVGAAAVIFGVFRTVQAFKKSKELDEKRPGEGLPPVDFKAYKDREGVRELYCSFDGHSFKPGYVIEDGDRKVLFEGKMTKQNPLGPRTYQFVNHLTDTSSDHQVGHTMTETVNDSLLSARSSFKFDGRDVWDVIHERGIRLETDALSKFPHFLYNAARDGKAFARIETSGKYVHEEDAAAHTFDLPVGRYYYRVWTDSEDLESLFLTVFAISETEQVTVE